MRAAPRSVTNGTMPGYIIAEVAVRDPDEYAEYRKLVPATLVPYGGRFIVRGGESVGLEGTPPAQRTVIIEFPSLAQAKAWWASQEYAAAKAIRQRTAESRLIAVAGVE